MTDRWEQDEVLLYQVVRGDRSALAALYDRYAPLLLALARRILGDPREAEDLVHDVFLESWREATRYDATRGSVRAWMLLRLRSRAIDRIKAPRLSRRTTLVEDHDTPRPVEEDPQLAPDRDRVRRALASLPDEQRAVLLLGYFEGLSSTEIAERCAVPVGTVKSRTAAGLAKLRAGLSAPSGALSKVES